MVASLAAAARWLGIGQEIATASDAVGRAVDSIFTSDEERLDKQAVLEGIRNSPYMAAMQIALENAKSGDAFTRRARPALIYAFVFIAVVQVSILPTLWWITQTFIDKSVAPPPEVVSTSDIMAIVSAVVAGVFVNGRTKERMSGRA